MKYIPTLLGLVFSCFLYQWLKSTPDYSVAAERSFFLVSGFLLALMTRKVLS